ncbi:MAG TPA: Ig-like domain-containing protein [Gemmatimonadaceae bacterium]|nr:Ig-like domain-containing protein [Gemmatimonadaceae bacterium]
MRIHSLIALTIAAAALSACDQATAPRVAGLGGTGTVSGGGTTTNNTTAPLLVNPGSLQLAVGATFQLGTNAPVSLQSQVQWTSLQSTIATVSASGLVSAVAPGTATIVARYAFDTTRAATATINVVGTTTTGGGTTGATGGSGNPGAP